MKTISLENASRHRATRSFLKTSLSLLALSSLLFLGGACRGEDDDNSSGNSTSEEESESEPTVFTGKTYDTFDWDGNTVTLSFTNNDVTLLSDDGTNKKITAVYDYDVTEGEEGSVKFTVSKFPVFANNQAAALALAKDLLTAKANTVEELLASATSTSDYYRKVLVGKKEYEASWKDFTEHFDKIVTKVKLYYEAKSNVKDDDLGLTASAAVTPEQYAIITRQADVLKGTYGASKLFGDSITFTIDTTSDSAVDNGDFVYSGDGSFKLTPLGTFETLSEEGYATTLGKGAACTGLAVEGDLKADDYDYKAKNSPATLNATATFPDKSNIISYDWSFKEAASSSKLTNVKITQNDKTKPDATLSAEMDASGSNEADITVSLTVKYTDVNGKLFVQKVDAPKKVVTK